MHVNRGGAIPVKHVSRFQQTHGKFTVLTGDEGLIPASNGVQRRAAVHDKGRYVRRFSPAELAELSTAASEGRCQGPVDPSCCTGSDLVRRQDPHAHTRQAIPDLILTCRPSLEARFKMVRWNSGVTDQLNQKLNAVWQGGKGQVSSVCDGSIRVSHQGKVRVISTLVLLHDALHHPLGAVGGTAIQHHNHVAGRFNRLLEKRQQAGFDVFNFIVNGNDGRQFRTLSRIHTSWWLESVFTSSSAAFILGMFFEVNPLLDHGWFTAAAHRRRRGIHDPNHHYPDGG